jgi:DNA polymerase-3 subunit gamma/tau
MSYVVLARKWRPQTFDDLVGQEHVSRTLANAIASNRVAHAFLFTGVRGVGKTTSARILAKALNCERGPTASPCLACAQCREIGEGSDLDVLEIDGATYTGIEKVRELQESLPYRPARDRFKIFIVDEVHMLSQAAWNAFLKTLEEPPPHVKFIFATTEVHKVPVTILSRCQRYDFKLIGMSEIGARLRHVLDEEKLRADDDAVRILAREAAGSMRDAMSLLDQVIAWAGDEGLTGDGVARVLGVAARTVLHELSGAVIAGEAARCLEIVGNLAHQGFSLAIVARDFLQHLRDLVAAKVGGDAARLGFTDAELAEVRSLTTRAELDDLSRLYLGFSRAFDDIARSAQPRAALEMALVRLSRRPPLVPIDDLLSRLALLERRVGGDSTRANANAPSATTGAAAPSAGRGPEESSAPKGEAGLDPARKAQATTRPSAAPGLEPAAPSPPVETAAQPRNEDALSRWRRIIDRIADVDARAASVLEHASPRMVESGRVTLGYEDGSFAHAQVTAGIIEAAKRAASEHFGANTEIFIDTSKSQGPASTVAAVLTAERAAQVAEARRRVTENPAVVAAIELLGAEIRDIRLSEG